MLHSSSVSDVKDIENAFVSFYNDLWCEENVVVQPTLEHWLETRAISSDCYDELLQQFSIAEVKKVLWSMPMGKVPGPDGFNVDFYKKYWDILGSDLVNSFNYFLNTVVLPVSWCRTFLSFIPKRPNPIKVVDFRLIALCNVNYRILAKLLANRIKFHLPFLISPKQSAFITGRHIHNNVALAYEIANYINCPACVGNHVIIKIDLEKAYDRLN